MIEVITPPSVCSVPLPKTDAEPWVADLRGDLSPDGCQSPVGFGDRSCGDPHWYAELHVGYAPTNPRWEGRLCEPCLAGWNDWAREEPDEIHVLSVNRIVTGRGSHG